MVQNWTVWNLNVDDTMFTRMPEAEVWKQMGKLSKKFEMRDLGKLRYSVWMQVVRDRKN
jgi:hypothetical protein